MLKNKSLLNVVLLSTPLFLTACGGEGDSGSASAPASSPAPVASTPAASDSAGGFDINSIEKAEGVVYMDEIYANWPYN